MLINRKLLDISVPIFFEAENHDNWIAVAASLSGEIQYLHEPLIFHRIHSSNVTTSLKTKGIFKRIKRTIQRIRDSENYIRNKRIMCEGLSQRFEIEKMEYNRELLSAFMQLLSTHGKEARDIMAQHRFSMVNNTQNRIFLMQIKNATKNPRDKKEKHSTSVSTDD